MKRALITAILLSISSICTAVDYFVDAANGSDSYTGLNGEYTSGTTGSWKTLDKVDGFSFAEGDDVYLLCGEQWIDTVTIDWNGLGETGTAQAGAATSITLAAGANATDDYYNGWTIHLRSGTGVGQNNIITDYNGTTKVATVSTWTTNPDVTSTYITENKTILSSYYMDSGSEVLASGCNGDSLPHIKGIYEYPANWNNTSAIPTSTYGSLVKVAANYTAVKYLEITDSAGFGLTIDETVGYHNNDVSFNEIHRAANATVHFRRNSYENSLRFNNISGCGQLEIDYPAFGTHPACNAAHNSWDNLYEGNYVYETKGEGLACYGSSANSNIFKDNVLAGIFSDAIYVVGCPDSIVENNFIVGDPSGTWDRNANGYPGTGIGVVSEREKNNTGVIVRNNFIAGTEYCFETGMWYTGYEFSGKFIGNTCVGVGTAIKNWTAQANATDKFEIANNIFQDYDSECSSVTDTNITFHDNDWADGNPADPDCDGTGDIYTSTVFNRTADFSLLGPLELPTSLDVEPVSGGAVAAGTPMTDVIIDLADYPLSSMVVNEISTTALPVDYLYQTRDAVNPDMGCCEVGSDNAVNGTPDGNVTLPYYMNLGDSATSIVTTVKTYLPEANCTSAVTWATTNTAEILLTDDDAVYQDFRSSDAALTCLITTLDGNYDVTFLHTEHYYGFEVGTTCVGRERSSNIAIENIVTNLDFDICAVTLAANTALRTTVYGVAVTGGIMTITFLPGLTGDPRIIISAIEVKTAETGSVMTVENATVTVTKENGFPSVVAISPVALAGVSTTTADGEVTISSIDDSGLTQGTTATIEGTNVLLTLTGPTITGSIGNVVVNFIDSASNTGQTTITVFIQREKRVKFTVRTDEGTPVSSTDWSISVWDFNPYVSGFDSSTELCREDTDGNTLNSDGEYTFISSCLPEPGTPAEPTTVWALVFNHTDLAIGPIRAVFSSPVDVTR